MNPWQHMAEQEKAHLEIFERLTAKHHVEPTKLLPLWHIAGWLLGLLFLPPLSQVVQEACTGASSALLGKEGAMACTVAVEESITEHYNDQIRELLKDDPEANKELLAVPQPPCPLPHLSLGNGTGS